MKQFQWVLACVTWLAMAAAPGFAQPVGDVALNPVPSMVASSLMESIRSQLLEPAKAEIKIVVHLPGGRGENGRICGEVTEQTASGPRTRTFFSTYTRAGRALTRFEDLPLAQFLERDAVFRNCSPRL
jgi:hypothetical protein